MSPAADPGSLTPRTSLFEHALRLHQQNPDAPLPGDGKPYPDDLQRCRKRPSSPVDRRLRGADAAVVLDAHFTRADAQPRDLMGAFDDVDVPIQPNDHLTAAALRVDRQRVRQTGRWLVRHSTDRYSAIVGLALLATDWTDEDVPLIQTIGLLSGRFGPLAAEALRRRRSGEEALLWLAQRVTGWGRVYVVEALCRRVAGRSRQWLLRHACDGDYLNGYFAGKVATAAHLHEAIVGTEVDDELVDHTGRLLRIMAGCGAMGMALEHYPPARLVLTAHAAHLARQAPTLRRFVDAAFLADGLAAISLDQSGWTTVQRDRLVRQYLAVLDRQDWCDSVRAGLDPGDDHYTWFTRYVATRQRLRALDGTSDPSRPPA